MNSRAIQWFRTTGFDLSLLVSLVFLSFGLRISDLSIRGEESRRATVAMEMNWTGDWIVPRQQGQPFLSRPPMENWLIALSARFWGGFSASAVRMPSILSVLLTSLLIYGYCRSILGRVASIGAAAGFASMPEILQMGRLAESDAIFTLFLGGAFLVWHWGMSRGWREIATWSAAYSLAACATLTKGPQAPTYFCATVGLYLIAGGQWRRLFSGAHLAGLAVYLLIVGAWMVPYWMQMGSLNTWKILTGDSTDRFVGLKWQDVVVHLMQYPIELVGCTAPWSYLLLAFSSRRFRASLEGVSPHVRYLFIAILVSFPTCWITPGGQTRYMMPLYPCVAVLAGIAIDRLSLASPRLQLAFTGIRGVLAAAFLGSASVLAFVTWIFDNPNLSPWRQPSVFALAFAISAIAACVAIWHSGPFSPGRVRTLGLLSVCAFVSLSYTGAVVNQLCARSEHAAEAVDALRRRMPSDAKLASLGPTHHKFAYEFGQPVELLPDNPDSASRVPPGGWFCYVSVNNERKSFAFPCVEVAAISMDRHHADHPFCQVIVMQRSENRQNAPRPDLAQGSQR